MSHPVDVYTETMATVYAQQGHWAKVAEIYRHLLASDPERRNYADALAEAEAKMKASGSKVPEQLVLLLREWIELLLKTEELNKLKKLKNGL